MIKRSSRRAYWPACKQALSMSNRTSNTRARAFFQTYFKPYRVKSDNTYTGLFTGYFEPSYKGSLTPTKRFGVPLYGKPYNLVKYKGLWRLKTRHGYTRLPSREQISSGPTLKDTPILAWVHSKVDRFFLQVQGSGSIFLPNGKRMLLGYAAQNGYPYKAIGKYLLQIGALTRKNISMQSIRQWLNHHPTRVEEVLNYTPSFTFFRKMNTQSPVGAQQVELTPGRSLAVDRKYITLGSPVFLSTYYPMLRDQQILKGQDFHRLLIAQDVGGAIKSAIRGDVFWGAGKRAQWLAGHMQSKGQIWVLKPS